MHLRAIIVIISFAFCAIALASAPHGLASHVDTTRVEGGIVSETIVTGWAPECSELRLEPPKTIVDFSPSAPLDTVDIWAQSCAGALPNPRGGSWGFLGPDAWRARRPITLAKISGAGSFECSVMFDMTGGAGGMADFTTEWRIVKGRCDSVSSL